MWFLKEYLGIGRIKNSVLFNAENNDTEKIEELKNIIRENTSQSEEYIENQIKSLKNIIDGNKNVISELESSNIPMYCLKDIVLKYKKELVRFDFIILTRKFFMILDTTSLNGDISISKSGGFAKYIKNKNDKTLKKNIMDNPIEKLDKSSEILLSILKEENLIKDIEVQTKLVISNPKSIISRSKAPLDILDKIVKYDEIEDHIRNSLKEISISKELMESNMVHIVNFLKENNIKVENYLENISNLNMLNPINL